MPNQVQADNQGTIEKILSKDNYLFVGCSDGNISIYGRKDNSLYHTLKLHSKPIIDFDIHPSGRLLISLGMDQRLKLSDLASTQEIYHKTLKGVKDWVRFTKDGDLLMGSDNKVALFNSEDNSETIIKEFPSKITCVQYNPSTNLLILGDNSGYIHITTYPKMHCISFPVYKISETSPSIIPRIKSLKHFPTPSLLLTVSTSGQIALLDLSFLDSYLGGLSGDICLQDRVSPIGEIDIEARLIAMDGYVEDKKGGRQGGKDQGESEEQKVGLIKSVKEAQGRFVQGVGVVNRQGVRRRLLRGTGLMKLRTVNMILKIRDEKERRKREGYQKAEQDVIFGEDSEDEN